MEENKDRDEYERLKKLNDQLVNFNKKDKRNKEEKDKGDER